MNWKEIDIALNSCVWNKIEEVIDEYVNDISEEFADNADYLKVLSLEFLNHFSTIISKHGHSIREIIGEQAYFEKLSAIKNKIVMRSFLKEIIRQSLTYVDEMSGKRSTLLVERAKDVIMNDLSNTELGLNYIATALYVNASYLSRIFKQETGEGIIEYITRNRMEVSMYLLDTTQLKIYQIAERVGISDAHYFSICFKKHLGMTTKEYRNRRRAKVV